MGTVPFLVLLLAVGFVIAEYPPPCDDDIYCYGEILHTVQMAEPFEDRKTYTDLPLKLPRTTVKSNFASMMANTSNNPSVEDIRNFLQENFKERGEELSSWNPPDWKPEPKFLSEIHDPYLRQFGSDLNALWKQLGKKIKDEVNLQPDMYSLEYLPNGVVLPGGRFLELYYWDTYWIIRGLLHCEMYRTVKAMLEDFLILLDRHGYVPNGNRIYYSRTQPPFLTQMVKEYADATEDWEFVEQALPYLNREFGFWINNRSVVIYNYEKSLNKTQASIVFRYINEKTGPRPESYSREFVLAETLESTQQRDEFYMNMKSGAESGWDFSSRWFPIDAPKNSTLLATKTSEVIPVDLNAIMLKNLRTLMEWSQMFGNDAEVQKYKSLQSKMKLAVDEILWDEEEGCWFDYNLQRKVRRKEFYPSNIFPLWTGAVTDTNTVIRVLNYLERTGALNWPGGIPTSLHNSGQQWDFPNAWPPLQHLFVESLEKSGYNVAQDVAFDVAQKWVANNYLTYKRYNNTMFEKLRADIPGEPGGGGYYDVVVGFGWTNGVILDFLKVYGDRLSAFYNDIGYQ